MDVQQQNSRSQMQSVRLPVLTLMPADCGRSAFGVNVNKAAVLATWPVHISAAHFRI